MYSAFVLFLIVFFGRETCVSVPSFSSIFYPIGRMYDRGLRGPPPQPSSGQRYHIETLVGITGARMAKYRSTWKEVILAPLKLIWRPHLLGILLFEVLLHFAEILLVRLKKASSTGPSVRFCDRHKRQSTSVYRNFAHILPCLCQVTNAVFLGSPKPEGYGFSQYAIAGAYGTPLVHVSVVRNEYSIVHHSRAGRCLHWRAHRPLRERCYHARYHQT